MKVQNNIKSQPKKYVQKLIDFTLRFFPDLKINSLMIIIDEKRKSGFNGFTIDRYLNTQDKKMPVIMEERYFIYLNVCIKGYIYYCEPAHRYNPRQVFNYWQEIFICLLSHELQHIQQYQIYDNLCSIGKMELKNKWSLYRKIVTEPDANAKSYDVVEYFKICKYEII